MHSQQSFELPTMLSSNYTEMDIIAGYSPNKFNEMRGRTFSSKLQVSKDSSMSSTKSLVVYHEKMEHNNALNEDIDIDNNSSALLYKTSQKKAIRVSKTADPYNNTVKIARSRLSFFLFSFRFIFLYSIFRTRIRVRVMRSHCHTAGHIR